MKYECSTPPRRREPCNQGVPFSCQFSHLSLFYSCTLNFSKQTPLQVASVNKLIWMLRRAPKLEKCIWQRFKPAPVPFCITVLLCVLTRVSARDGISKMLSTLYQATGWLLSRSELHGTLRVYAIRSFWFQRKWTNPALFKNIIVGDSCISAPRVEKPLPYSLWNTQVIIDSQVRKTHFRADSSAC